MKNLLPDSIFHSHIIALGKTGSGKSSAMRLIVEHLLDKKTPICIVDPKGDWWGIKSSADGKHAGYPLVIFGGEHADVPINYLSGKTVAELAATGNRPCVIDLGGWMPTERTRFWIDFASTFFRATRGLRVLLVDEVHNFCPKGKVLSPQAGEMLHWSNRLASEGRGKGITLLAASQRPQKVHNDFLTSCETLIAMRVVHAADRVAYEDWIDGCGDPEKGSEVVSTLASMKRGEAWVWSPENDFGPKRIHFPMFSTYDSFKPQNTQQPAKLKGWADVDLGEITKKLETVVKEAEANDPVKLKTRIRELEKNLSAASSAVKSKIESKLVSDPRAIERAVREVATKYSTQIDEQQKVIHKQQRTLKLIAEAAAQAVTIEAPKLKPIPLPKLTVPTVTLGSQAKEYRKAGLSPFTGLHEYVEVPTPYDGTIDRNGSKLRAGAERMLAALAQWSPAGMPEGQMRSHAGMKKSGTFSTYMSDLRKGGYIEERGEEVFATQAGLDYCQHVPAAPRTTEEVLAVWSPKLRNGARRMLEVLVQHQGETISKDDLGQEAGLAKSGTFSTYLSDLRTARLVLVHGDRVGANKETLFL